VDTVAPMTPWRMFAELMTYFDVFVLQPSFRALSIKNRSVYGKILHPLVVAAFCLIIPIYVDIKKAHIGTQKPPTTPTTIQQLHTAIA